MKMRRAFVILVLISMFFSAVAVYISLRQIASNDHKFCDVINAAIGTPIPKPANPAADPSRERIYEFYLKYVTLDHRLGC